MPISARILLWQNHCDQCWIWWIRFEWPGLERALVTRARRMKQRPSNPRSTRLRMWKTKRMAPWPEFPRYMLGQIGQPGISGGVRQWVRSCDSRRNSRELRFRKNNQVQNRYNSFKKLESSEISDIQQKNNLLKFCVNCSKTRILKNAVRKGL